MTRDIYAAGFGLRGVPGQPGQNGANGLKGETGPGADVTGAQITAARDAAVAAKTAAESARAGAEAVGTLADTQIAGRINTFGSATDTALKASFGDATGAQAFAVQRIDRQAAARARVKGADASVAYSDAIEVTNDWSTATGVASGATRATGRLYANPGGELAVIPFPVADGETAHIATVVHWKPGSSGSYPCYFGLGTVSQTDPGGTGPNGIFAGWNGGANRTAFVGATVQAAATSLQSEIDGYKVPIGAEPNASAEGDYLFVIDVGLTIVSMSVTRIGAASANTYVQKFARATLTAAGKSIQNISLYLQDSRNTSGTSYGPVVAVKSLQPTRTKAPASIATEGTEHRVHVTTVGGDPWRYALPKTYDARRPAPVVVYCHQSLTGSETSPWSESRAQPLLDALLNAGFIVAAAKDNGDRWGNAVSQANYQALHEHLRDRYNTAQLFMIGVSMGMLPVLNALGRRSLPTPSAVVSIGGVCNLDDLFAQGAYAPGIKTAYGIASDGSDYEAKTAGFNPIDRAGWEFRGVPMRFYTSAGDTAVPKATGCDALAAKVLPYSPEATVAVKSGGHLDSSQFPPSEIVSFFQTYL